MTMKITIVGAAGGEVTGSAYCVQTRKASVLVDCGRFQGGRKPEALNRPTTRPKQRFDLVPLTHGHLDHTGRLPLLTKMIQWRFRLTCELPTMCEVIAL
jgi:metallo-beta-lactamase family protein